MRDYIIARAFAALSVKINGSGDDRFTTYVTNLIRFSITVLAPVGAIVMLGYAAFLYFSSGGEESKATQAKEIAVGVISGYALLLMISGILNFLTK